MEPHILVTKTQSRYYCSVLVLLTVVIRITECLEEPKPEIFLLPRNFNPHPYEVSAQTNERNGPVLFPQNPDDNLVENRSNFVTVRNFPLRDIHPVDNHPYSKVAKKHKYRVTGRFGDEDKPENEQARKALAKHATEVLSFPPEQLARYKTPSRQRAKDYAFSYKVVDHLRGDDFSHTQTRNSKATNGEYRVKLPDGRVQIVSYTADKNSYKADVKYTENEGVTDQPDNPIQVQRIPVREIYPLQQDNSLDYHNDVQSQKQNILVVVPTQIPRNFNSHGNIIAAPSPTYLSSVQNRELLRQTYPKVEIYTTNARDYITGSYIPSTVSPYLEKYTNNLQTKVIDPEITINGDHGLSAPTTSSSFVLSDHHGLVLDNIKLVSTTSSPLIQNSIASTTPSPLYLSDLFATVTPRF